MLLDDQLRLAAHDLHRVAFVVDYVRVTDQLEQQCLNRNRLARGRALPHRYRRGRAILRLRKLGGVCRRGQPAQRASAAFRPGAVAIAALLARRHRQVFASVDQIPHQPDLARACAALFTPRRRGTGVVGELLQRLQTEFPHRDSRRHQRRERMRTELSVHRRRLPASRRERLAGARVQRHAGTPDDRQELRQCPGETMRGELFDMVAEPPRRVRRHVGSCPGPSLVQQ